MWKRTICEQDYVIVSQTFFQVVHEQTVAHTKVGLIDQRTDDI